MRALALHAFAGSVVGATLALGVASAATAPTDRPVTGIQPSSFGSPWIAADPAGRGRLAVGYSDSTNFNACYLALSRNSGKSWTNRAVVGQGARYPLARGYNTCEYPVVAYGPAGTLYFVFDAIKTGSFPSPALVFVMTSRNSGASFGAPVRVEHQAKASDIIPKVAVDEHSGRLYVTWQANLKGGAYGARVASSSDHGKSFSAATAVNPRGTGGANPDPAVGPDGRLYVAYTDLTGFNGKHPTKGMVASSRDHGTTFGRPVLALPMASCYDPSYACQQDPQGQYVYNPGIEVAAGRSPGQVFVAGDYLAGAKTFRLAFAASSDGGRSWSSKAPVGIPPGAAADSQLGNPTIAAAPDGRIDVAYYDLAEPSGLESTYLISSTNAGRSFSPPVRVSSASSDVSATSSFGFADEPYSVGHLVAALDRASYVAWTDSRRGTKSTGKNDVYFAAVPR